MGLYGGRRKIVKKPIDGKTARRELNVFEKWLQIEQDITEALKKQYPEEPISYGEWFDCPVCGAVFAITKPKYCPDCGQALDWRNKNGDNT